MNKDEAEALVGKHADALAEHFDNVRIFVNWPNEDDHSFCKSYSVGRGSYLAQSGQVREWIIEMDEYVRGLARAEARENGEE